MSILIDTPKPSVLEEAPMEAVTTDVTDSNDKHLAKFGTSVRASIFCVTAMLATTAMWVFALVTTRFYTLPHGMNDFYFACYLMFLTYGCTVVVALFSPKPSANKTFYENYPGFVVLYAMTVISCIVLSLPINYEFLG